MTRPDPPLFFTKQPFEKYAHPKVVDLWRREQFEQRTPEWFQARMKGISASDISKAMTMNDDACDHYIETYDLHETFEKKPKKCCDHYSNTKELIIKKCKKSDTGSNLAGNAAIAWGVKYEPIVQSIYAQMRGEDVLEFGLLFHGHVPFLMASPDGITAKSATMLEIKCPSKRKVGPVPPLHYFHQMLMQLEVCQLDHCDFFDCCFVEYMFEDEWLADALEWWRDTPEHQLPEDVERPEKPRHHVFGIVLYNPAASKNEAEPKYFYAEPTIATVSDFLRWAEEQQRQYFIEHEVQLERHYYKLEDYALVRVHRNDDFLKRNLDTFSAVWDRIEYYRSPEGQNDFLAFEKAGKRGTSAATSEVAIVEPKELVESISLTATISDTVTESFTETQITETQVTETQVTQTTESSLTPTDSQLLETGLLSSPDYKASESVQVAKVTQVSKVEKPQQTVHRILSLLMEMESEEWKPTRSSTKMPPYVTCLC